MLKSRCWSPSTGKIGFPYVECNIAKDRVYYRYRRHGLRKTAAVRQAEATCPTERLKSITGHRTDQMAAHYAKGANQRLRANPAIRRLEEKMPNPNF